MHKKVDSFVLFLLGLEKNMKNCLGEHYNDDSKERLENLINLIDEGNSKQPKKIMTFHNFLAQFIIHHTVPKFSAIFK
jgi:hypothetical protein